MTSTTIPTPAEPRKLHSERFNINERLRDAQKRLLEAIRPHLDEYMAETGLCIESIEVETYISNDPTLAPAMTGGNVSFQDVDRT